MKILIAEDGNTSRQILSRTLQDWGYEVIATQNGQDAWRTLLKPDAPRMALFDWNMPGLTGIELCRRIRSVSRLRQTYIILLTARNSRQDLIEGLNAGADDYLSKPFDHEEFKARLQVGIRIQKLQASLAEKNQALRRYAIEMESLAEERTQQLLHADRMASIGLMAAGIAHEINNPTTFISGNVQMQARFWGKITPLLEKAKDTDKNLQFIWDEMPRTIEDIQLGVKRIARIVNGLKTFCRPETSTQSTCDINQCIEASLLLCHNQIKKNITLHKTLIPDLPPIKGNQQQLEQVFINLFNNGAQAMGEQGGTLHINTLCQSDHIVIQIRDSGPGIPQEQLNAIWHPFYTTKPVGVGTGLGLSITQSIVHAHGGQIAAENMPEGGACFSISLPIFRRKKHESEPAHCR